MKKNINWGIIGTGAIAKKFSMALKELPDAVLLGVASRTIDKAKAFSEEFDVEKAYGNYEELAKDADIDVIYIATPHPFHAQHSLLCINNGKAVLCEKPVAMNANEMRQVAKAARDNGVFFMEGMWTRFLPAIVQVREWLSAGLIGEPLMMSANLCFKAGFDSESRLYNLNLGGGSLLDVGIYVTSFASLVFGAYPEQALGLAHIGQTGVDERATIQLKYSGGRLAMLSCGITVQTTNDARIFGTRGDICIPSFIYADKAELCVNGKEKITAELPKMGNGYAHEAIEVMSCLREGKLESDTMPIDESIAIMDILDGLRSQWGLRYPME